MTLLRPLDEPIPDDEALYRSVAPDDVKEGSIFETAVDLKGTSVYRQKFCTTALLALSDANRKRPTHTGIASVLPKDLPPSKVYNDVTWQVFTIDNPDEAEYLAHAEVRVRRDSDAPNRDCVTPSSKSVKLLLKQAIARGMKIAIAPEAGLAALAAPVTAGATESGMPAAVLTEDPNGSGAPQPTDRNPATVAVEDSRPDEGVPPSAVTDGSERPLEDNRPSASE